MKTALTSIMFSTLLAGCVSLGQSTLMVIERPDFPESEYAALDGRTGTAVVTGQAFLRTVGGDVKYAAGSEVILNPVTSYSEFWYKNIYNNNIANSTTASADVRQNKYLIVTQADGTGNFRFENVPPGEYYLTSHVTWGVPRGQYSQIEQQGGYISERITVNDGQEIRKILTR